MNPSEPDASRPVTAAWAAPTVTRVGLPLTAMSPAPSPPPRRRLGLLVTVGIAAVVVIGGGITAAVSFAGRSAPTPSVAAADTSAASAPVAPSSDIADPVAAASGATAGTTDDAAPVSTAATPTAVATTPSVVLGLDGTWSGSVYGDQDGFDVVVDLTEDGSRLTGDVSYPQLGCTGTWQEKSRDTGRVYLLEQITSGPCVQTDVVLTLGVTGTLGFRSSWSDKVVYAQLSR